MHTGFAISMSVFIYHGFIKSNIPFPWKKQHVLDGCSKMQTFFKIVFPLLKPTTTTLVILNVLAFWNDYLTPIACTWKKRIIYIAIINLSFLWNLFRRLWCDYGGTGTYRCSDSGILYLFLQKQIIQWCNCWSSEIIIGSRNKGFS
jgi:raffinose/stachyose/melibiose transport system permease protein